MTAACNWHPEIRCGDVADLEEHMDAEHDHWRAPELHLRSCSGCGVVALGSIETDGLDDGRCMHCPPVACVTCGEPDDRCCSCWVSIENLPLADIKALFAAGDSPLVLGGLGRDPE